MCEDGVKTRSGRTGSSLTVRRTDVGLQFDTVLEEDAVLGELLDLDALLDLDLAIGDQARAPDIDVIACRLAGWCERMKDGR